MLVFITTKIRILIVKKPKFKRCHCNIQWWTKLFAQHAVFYLISYIQSITEVEETIPIDMFFTFGCIDSWKFVKNDQNNPKTSTRHRPFHFKMLFPVTP